MPTAVSRNGETFCAVCLKTETIKLKIKFKMKKIILCSFLAISILSCKKINNGVKTETSTETKKDSLVETKISIAVITDSLKNGEYSKEFAKYSDETIKKVAEKMGFYYTIGGSGEEQLKEITSFKNDIISLYCSLGQNGPSDQHEKILLKNNNVIYLGNGFDQLTEKESQKLEKEIKSKIKNFSHFSGRSESEINVKENGNYLIIFSGLTDEDAEASGGSLEISYETKDLKTYIPSTLKIVVRK